VSADVLSLVVINAVTGVLLGLAITLAVDILPGRRPWRFVVHWTVIGAWALVLLVIGLVVVDPGLARILRRWLNVAAIGYVGGLLVVHARRSPWKRKVKP